MMLTTTFKFDPIWIQKRVYFWELGRKTFFFLNHQIMKEKENFSWIIFDPFIGLPRRLKASLVLCSRGSKFDLESEWQLCLIILLSCVLDALQLFGSLLKELHGTNFSILSNLEVTMQVLHSTQYISQQE